MPPPHSIKKYRQGSHLEQGRALKYRRLCCLEFVYGRGIDGGVSILAPVMIFCTKHNQTGEKDYEGAANCACVWMSTENPGLLPGEETIKLLRRRSESEI